MIASNNLSVDFVCVDIMVGGICLFKNQWGYICRGGGKYVISMKIFKILEKNNKKKYPYVIYFTYLCVIIKNNKYEFKK